VLAAPDVPHMDVVSRSVARRRPCDEKGDGYRDTLIWFSVLLAAREHPDEVVLLVTNDSDFMDDDRQGFHADLVDDLSQINATARVRLVQVLADVVLELAGSAPERPDLRKLKSDLKDETVRHFVATLQPELRDRSLDPKECALPRATRTSVLGDMGPIEGFRYELKGGLTQDEAVAEFSFEAHSRVVLSLPTGVTPDDYEAVLSTGDEGVVLYAIAKPLVFRGIVRLGRYDRPLGGEITRVSARSDDPGHGEWRRRPSSGQFNSLADVMKNMNVNPLADVMKNMNVNPLADVMKNMNVNPLADIMKNMNVNPLADIMMNMNVNPLAEEQPRSQANREAAEDDDPGDIATEPVDRMPEGDDTN
jgi:hypothetical protein